MTAAYAKQQTGLSLQPREVERFRRETNVASRFGTTARQTCPGCRRTRSLIQFEGGKKELCRKCRGVK